MPVSMGISMKFAIESREQGRNIMVDDIRRESAPWTGHHQSVSMPMSLSTLFNPSVNEVGLPL